MEAIIRTPLLVIKKKEEAEAIIHALEEECTKIENSGGNYYGSLMLEELKSLVGDLRGQLERNSRILILGG